MATINYCTVIVPDVLFKNIKIISSTPHFKIYRHATKPGLIFRLPHELEAGITCHVFFEHEINLSNTLRSKSLTFKKQLTFVPVSYGVFCGYEKLDGEHHWTDEEDYEREHFIPNYNSDKNVKRIAPLPIKLHSELYDYLTEILFQYQDNAKFINDCIVNLGCQLQSIQKAIIIPEPSANPSSTLPAFVLARKTEKAMALFTGIQNGQLELFSSNNGI